MNLPEILEQNIETMLEGVAPQHLKKAFHDLSINYREDGVSPHFFKNEIHRLAYIAVRMPATFSAVKRVLKEFPHPVQSWIDIGAGPGTASWAILEHFPDTKSLTLFEKSKEAITLGQKLASGNLALQEANWISGSSPNGLEKSDVALFSYSLGEFEKPLDWIHWWWQKEIPYLIVIEPGTPTRFNLLRKVREEILKLGASIIAPCTHHLKCPMQGKDWCHFATRVERTKLHRYLKGASLGFEDEKFSYLIVSRNKLENEKKSRILRHPLKLSGHIDFTLCTFEGNLEKKTTSKKDKEKYLLSKKLEWGDLLNDKMIQ